MEDVVEEYRLIGTNLHNGKKEDGKFNHMLE
jgi:hypothetical protein